MKTGMNQRELRQNICPIQAPFSAKNHSRNTLIPNAVPPNPTESGLENKQALAPAPPPLLAPVKSSPIRVHQCPSVVNTLMKNKNYQTNPFVIFQIVRKHNGLWLSSPTAGEKTNPFNPKFDLCSPSFKLRYGRMSEGIFHLGTLIPEP